MHGVKHADVNPNINQGEINKYFAIFKDVFIFIYIFISQLSASTLTLGMRMTSPTSRAVCSGLWEKKRARAP